MAKQDLILVALDPSPTLKLMGQALRAVGYQTVDAIDSSEIDKVLLENSPALVLLGETLNGIKSTQLIERMLDRFPTLPIVFLADQTPTTLTQEVFRAGVSGYLQPPMTIEDIVETVKNSLKRARQTGDWVRREVSKTTASLEKRVSELEVLVHLGHDITGSLALNDVLNNVVAAAVKLTKAEEGSLLLLDEKSGDLYMRAGHNFEKGFAESFRLPVQDTLAGQVIKTGEPIYFNKNSLHKIKTAYLVQSLIYVPLRQKDKVIGVLGVDNRQHQLPFSERDMLLLTILADYASVAIENAHLYQASEIERSKFEAVFSNMEDALIILDEKENIQLVNNSFCTAFSVSKTSVLNKPISEVIVHDDLQSLLKRKDTEPLRYHEIHFSDGRVLNAQYAPVRGVGAAITMQDISYLKELDRLKDDFVHTVSHDLRSPLTAVLGYAELLERIGTLNDQQKEFVRRIQSSVQDITSLVNDLLDLGRIESGFDTRREVVKLDGILRYSLDTFEQQIQEKGQKVDVEIAPDLQPMRGNPIRLRQVLDNLISNAIKYTPDEENILVKLSAGGDQLILQVTDNGPGIPQADQPHIFDKFYRASNVPSNTSGSGLGLAIVKTIVESHQGRIWFESNLDEGSTFFVVLPAYQEEQKNERK